MNRSIYPVPSRQVGGNTSGSVNRTEMEIPKIRAGREIATATLAGAATGWLIGRTLGNKEETPFVVMGAGIGAVAGLGRSLLKAAWEISITDSTSSAPESHLTPPKLVP